MEWTVNNKSASHKPAVHPEFIWIMVILLVAAILRFYNYAAFSFSNDELSALNRLRFDTFNDLVEKGFFVDGHPGGIQIMLWYWSKLFGTSEQALRFPFVIFGILAVFFTYRVGKRMFGPVTGLFASAAMAFLHFPLLYSQIARPYVSGLFFSLLMVHFWLNVVFGRKNKESGKISRFIDLAGFALSAVLCMYNHYFSFLFAVIVGFSGFFFIRRQDLLAYLVAGVVAVAMFLPHLAITINHLSYGGVGLWLGKPGPRWLLQHLNYILNDSGFTIILMTLTSILVSWQGKMIQHPKGMITLNTMWFLLPMAVGYIYSWLVNPVLQHPVLIFSFPYVIILLFMSGGKILGRFQQVLLGTFIILGLIGTVGVKKYYSIQHFGEFRGIAENTRAWEDEFGVDSMNKVVIANSPFYLDYYFLKMNDSSGFDLYDIKNTTDRGKFVNLVRTSDKPYFLYAWTKPAPSGLENIIRSVYPFVVRNINYGTLSRITLFSKERGYDVEPGVELTLLYSDSLCFDKTKEDVVGGTLAGSQKTNSQFNAFMMDSATEYSQDVEAVIKESESGNSLRIVATARIKAMDFPTDALLVVTVASEEGETILWESTPIDVAADTIGWNQVYCAADFNGRKHKNVQTKMYLWNKSKKSFLYDDLKVKIFRYDRYSPFEDNQEIRGSLD